ELRRLLDRQVARLRSAQNLVDILGRASVQVREAWAVGHQTGRFDVLPLWEHCGQARGERKGVDTEPVRVHARVAGSIKRLRAAREPLEPGRYVLNASDGQWDDLEAERASCGVNLFPLRQPAGIVSIGHDGQPTQILGKPRARVRGVWQRDQLTGLTIR